MPEALFRNAWFYIPWEMAAAQFADPGIAILTVSALALSVLQTS